MGFESFLGAWWKECMGCIHFHVVVDDEWENDDWSESSASYKMFHKRLVESNFPFVACILCSKPSLQSEIKSPEISLCSDMTTLLLELC